MQRRKWIGPLCAAAIGVASLAGTPGAALAQAQPASFRPALDGIFEAFRTHPLVGIGEAHEVAQFLDFYRKLIRDPRFASEVGHVVVEFGGASQQQVIDRYVNGEKVPYEELRKVWNQTVGWRPTVISEGYALFFSEVRQVNTALPEGRRIKVWLGEPVIDWSKIRSAEDFRPILATRDSHAAAVIERNILGPGRKALVIYGRAHFDVTQDWENEALAAIAAADPGGPMSRGRDDTLRDLIEARHPGSFFVAQAYRGFRNAECTRSFEAELPGQWPAVAMQVRGTVLEQAIRRCLTPPTLNRGFPPSVPVEVQNRVRALVAANADRDQPLLADAMLFVAPAAELTTAAPFLEFALDEQWREELDRRAMIITGRPMPKDWARSMSQQPRPYTARD